MIVSDANFHLHTHVLSTYGFGNVGYSYMYIRLTYCLSCDNMELQRPFDWTYNTYCIIILLIPQV